MRALVLFLSLHPLPSTLFPYTTLFRSEPHATPSKSFPPLKITKVRTIQSAPQRTRLVVVKVETSESGLYGLGCATFNQRDRKSTRLNSSHRCISYAVCCSKKISQCPGQ